MHGIRRTLAILGLVLVATAAWAVTVSEVQSAASSLLTTYQSIDAEASACPNGACANRASIEADFANAESRRTQLHADRQSLEPCSSCQELDATIGQVDAAAATLRAVLDGWDDQS